MGITRRDLIGLTGGVAAGTVLTPVPYKLLDDAAIWSQNWSWTPRPPAGPVSVKAGVCTLCTAGCALQARCSAVGVYGIAPVATDPLSGGALCAAVYGAHQLPYHPLRLKHAMVRGKAVPTPEAVKAVAGVLRAAHENKAKIAFVDERPGRMLTAAYGGLLKQLGGQVVAAPQPEAQTLSLMEKLSGLPGGSLGFDFQSAGIILSLGAPLLDGWGAPGGLTRLWSERKSGSGPMFVYAGATLSRTALLSDRRLLLTPGSEAAFVAGLAGVLVRSGAAASETSRFAREAAAFPLEAASTKTGVPAAEIENLARLIAEKQPAVVIGGDPLAAGLNALLRSVIVSRRAAPGPDAAAMQLDAVSDGSLAVLIHDASTPSALVSDAVLRRKLAPGGTLVRLTAYQPEADAMPEIAVPMTAFLESLDDAPGPRESGTAAWSVAAALLPAPTYALTPAALLAQLSKELGMECEEPEALMKRKAEAIAAARRGNIHDRADGSTTPVAKAGKGDEIWKKMTAGAAWVDEPQGSAPPRFRLDELAVTIPEGINPALTLVATSWKGTGGFVPSIPLATKVEQESRLRAVPGEARVHPHTALRLGLSAGDRVTVTAANGRAEAKLRVEPSVRPGLVEIAAAGASKQTLLRMGRIGDGEAQGSNPVEMRRS